MVNVLLSMVLIMGLTASCHKRGATPPVVDAIDVPEPPEKDRVSEVDENSVAAKRFECDETSYASSYPTEAETLIVEAAHSVMEGDFDLKVWANGNVVVRRLSRIVPIDSQTREGTVQLSAADLRKFIAELVDQTCLFAITESSVREKVAMVNKANGATPLPKTEVSECDGPRLKISLGKSTYESHWNSCNDFNTRNPAYPFIEERQYVTKAHQVILELVDQVLPPSS